MGTVSVRYRLFHHSCCGLVTFAAIHDDLAALLSRRNVLICRPSTTKASLHSIVTTSGYLCRIDACSDRGLHLRRHTIMLFIDVPRKSALTAHHGGRYWAPLRARLFQKAKMSHFAPSHTMMMMP